MTDQWYQGSSPPKRAGGSVARLSIVLELDHVVLAVGDLDEAGRRLLAASGLASVPGGSHPRWGTANRIVPLGPNYVELMGIGDPERAGTTELGRTVAAAAGSDHPWVMWVVRTDPIESVAERAGLEVSEGSRERPDGSVLRWRMAGLDRALAEPPLPFFQVWEVGPGEHPGGAGAHHRVQPRGISWIELAGDERRLRWWLGDAELPLRIVDGTPGIKRVGIATAEGEMVLDGSEVTPATG
jgi:hypothetical protein